MMQVLNKRHLAHIDSFKKALKIHSEHVQQRQKRVGEDAQFRGADVKIFIVFKNLSQFDRTTSC